MCKVSELKWVWLCSLPSFAYLYVCAGEIEEKKTIVPRNLETKHIFVTLLLRIQWTISISLLLLRCWCVATHHHSTSKKHHQILFAKQENILAVFRSIEWYTVKSRQAFFPLSRCFSTCVFAFAYLVFDYKSFRKGSKQMAKQSIASKSQHFN